MVRHRQDGREYWTLPGGAVEVGETAEEAVTREVLEECGLHVVVDRVLFDEPFRNGWCRCFLVHCLDLAQAVLGYDPEEADLDPEQRMLRGLEWLKLEDMRDDVQVRQVIAALSLDGGRALPGYRLEPWRRSGAGLVDEGHP